MEALVEALTVLVLGSVGLVRELRGLPDGLGTGLTLLERGVTKLPVREPARCIALLIRELGGSASVLSTSSTIKRDELMGVREVTAQVGYCEVISSMRLWRSPSETRTRTKHSAACWV